MLDARAAAATADPETVTVPVVYDGEDLAEVGRLTGWGADGVVARHTATTWTVAFSGFAPGFGYCVADDGPGLAGAPARRPRAPGCRPGRSRSPTAGPGVYPTASPGGWQLLGRTTAAVWDLDRDPPALLRPGVRVRFVDAGGRDRPPSRRPPRRGAGAVSLEVLATGPLTTVQDEGRVGSRVVGRAALRAPATAASYRLGLRLVGGDPGAASLEVTLGGLAVRARRPLVVAVTGARCPGAPWNAPVRLAAGEVLRLGTPAEGLRSYLAVRGGLDVAPVLGSRSTCTLSGLGPPRVRAGDVLPVGPAAAPMPGVDEAPVPAPARRAVVLDVEPGPRLDRVGEQGWDRLLGTAWTVGTDSDRVGRAARRRPPGARRRLGGRGAAERGGAARRGPGAAVRRAGRVPRRLPR